MMLLLSILIAAICCFSGTACILFAFEIEDRRLFFAGVGLMAAAIFICLFSLSTGDLA